MNSLNINSQEIKIERRKTDKAVLIDALKSVLPIIGATISDIRTKNGDTAESAYLQGLYNNGLSAINLTEK